MKKLFALITAATILGGCSLFGYNFFGNSATPGLGVNPADPEAFFRAFIQNYASITSFRAIIESMSPEGTQTATIEYQAPDKTHMTAESDQGTTETITTPEGTYFKQPGSDTWLKLGVGKGDEMADNVFKPNELESEYSGEDAVLPEYLGEEPCGQLTCHVYAMTDMGAESKIFIDTKDLLLRQMSMVDGDMTTTITYEYTDVVIEPPADVQEFSIPENPSLEDLQQLQDIYGGDQ